MLDRFLTFQINKSISNTSTNIPSTSTSTSSSTPSSSSTSSIHPKDLRNGSNPFRPFLNPSTNKWWSAKISARREAQLVDLAMRTGTLDLIHDQSNKLNKLKSRLLTSNSSINDIVNPNSNPNLNDKGTSSSILPTLSLRDEVWILNHHPSLNQNSSSTSTSSNNGSASGITKESEVKRTREMIEKEAKLEQYRVLRRLISKKGPYKGRKSIKMFKGTKDERNRQSRWNGINEKLEEMDGKVKEWRMVSSFRKEMKENGMMSVGKDSPFSPSLSGLLFLITERHICSLKRE